MAIGRAQIPEEIDAFQDGGTAEISADDIIALYSGLQKSPITQDDIAAQMQELSFLFPQYQKPSIFELASSLSAGLSAQAASGRPASIGLGLAQGFNAFADKVNKRKADADKMRQELAMLAYQQLQAQKQAELETSKEILEMQFDQAIEQGGLFQGTSTLASALNFILRAEENPNLKNTPEYELAVAVAEQPKVTLQQTEQGTVQVQQPGIDIKGILQKRGSNVGTIPSTVEENGVIYTYTGKTDPKTGLPVYVDAEGNQGVFE
tara:strand:+ start:1693 stop:2484 length:792 start_codon:yes stop_codon:yes gene_type:complete